MCVCRGRCGDGCDGCCGLDDDLRDFITVVGDIVDTISTATIAAAAASTTTASSSTITAVITTATMIIMIIAGMIMITPPL